MEADPDVRLKVVFTGETNAGKTTLIYWQTQRVFFADSSYTIGIDFRMKAYQIGATKIQGRLWDTVGSERYRTMNNLFYRNSHAACVCFSLNDRYSFEKVPLWVNSLRLSVVECPLFLVGCKADLEHVVTLQEIKEYASKEEMTYFQTSSKSDIGVTESIQKVMETAYEYYQKNPHVMIKQVSKSTQPRYCWS